MTLDSAEPLVAISPHLDDGVFSCGELLSRHPGSVSLTVFAGVPAAYGCLSPWDALSGFEDGSDVVAARRREDESALAALKARPWWLDFLDAQYGDSPSAAAIAAALSHAIEVAGAGTVVMPLGLFHSDHRLASDAALLVAPNMPELSWFMYEDAIYRAIEGLAEERRRSLGCVGWRLTPVDTCYEPCDSKREAVRAYKSQLRALAAPGKPGFSDAFEPERYHRLSRVEP